MLENSVRALNLGIKRASKQSEEVKKKRRGDLGDLGRLVCLLCLGDAVRLRLRLCGGGGCIESWLDLFLFFRTQQ